MFGASPISCRSARSPSGKAPGWLSLTDSRASGLAPNARLNAATAANGFLRAMLDRVGDGEEGQSAGVASLGKARRLDRDGVRHDGKPLDRGRPQRRRPP